LRDKERGPQAAGSRAYSSSHRTSVRAEGA
jgi:hypothetical protein